MTFTRDPNNAPAWLLRSTAYLAAMATGLREAHGWYADADRPLPVSAARHCPEWHWPRDAVGVEPSFL